MQIEFIKHNAPVAQWIEYRSSEPWMWVRFLPGAHDEKIPTAWDFFGRVRAGDMFLSTKTVEAGSWKFRFDKSEIIPDHKDIGARHRLSRGSENFNSTELKFSREITARNLNFNLVRRFRLQQKAMLSSYPHKNLRFIVRVGVIETPSHPWQGCVLPLNHTRDI
jgi:hypothetical protein